LTTPWAIRIVIADPHLRVRQLLASLIAGAEDIRVVAETASTQDTLAAIQRERPDVLLLDEDLAHPDSIAAFKSTQEQDEIKIVVLVTYPERCLDALASGASDCLSKDSGAVQLLGAIRTAYLERPM
jgi:two-component system NarL family response regulator